MLLVLEVSQEMLGLHRISFGDAVLPLPDPLLIIKTMFRSALTNKLGIEKNNNITNNKVNETIKKESNDIESEANKMERDSILLKRNIYKLSENI